MALLPIKSIPNLLETLELYREPRIFNKCQLPRTVRNKRHSVFLGIAKESLDNVPYMVHYLQEQLSGAKTCCKVSNTPQSGI